MKGLFVPLAHQIANILNKRVRLTIKLEVAEPSLWEHDYEVLVEEVVKALPSDITQEDNAE